MRVTRTLILLSSFLIAALWSTLANEGLSAVSEQLYNESGVNHALIIGIGDYDQWKNFLESPSNPSKDAAEIYRILTEKYNFKKENVILLNDDSNEEPSLLNIVTHLDNYLNNLTEKDNLLIFYSGHSKEDEEGETYWIPKEASERLKQTWLSHSEICNDYIGSEDFKAKNVVIITDSLFSKKLLKSSSAPPDPKDRRYTDKVRAKALKRSREVISLGNKYFEGDYEGYGLFTYYFRKSLMNNWLEVIDFENLIFDEEIDFYRQVGKIVGVTMVWGRLKNSTMEDGGQAVITRVISPPMIDITDAYSTPEKGYAGEEFRIDAVTNRSASDVYVELNGREYPMDGEGTKWTYTTKVASIGKSSFRIFAFNEDDVEGKSIKKDLETIAPEEGLVIVTDAQVSPKQGEGGDEFTFTAKTDSSAKKVMLIIGNERYDMTGSGTSWTLKQKIEQSGSVAFAMIAVNEDGVEGQSKAGGALAIKAPKINIVNVKASPNTGYAGDEFTFTASTDFPSRSVELKVGDKRYEMKGSGKEWQLEQEISDIGKLSFTMAAINTEGISGDSKGGEISTTERPADIPDIDSVRPNNVFAGEDIYIRVKTSADAEEVTLELDGKSVAMEGSGTDWQYQTRIASVGTASYKVIAKNKDGRQGKAREGSITITEKVGIDVAQAKVSPEKGNMGDTFTFTATTKEPAKSVAAVIGDKRYPMTGSGTSWTLKQKIEDYGTIVYSIVATDDKGEEGSPKEGSLVADALLANVINATATSPNNFANEEFLFKVNTDNPAKSVSLEIDGIPYDMEGSGKVWQFTKTIHDIGTIEYKVLAKNIEDKTGTTVSQDLEVKRAIPDIKGDVAFSTDTIYAGEDFSISVTTTTSADQVLLNIAGKSEPMTGSGTDWTYTTQIADIGSKPYTVVAKNSDGTEGKSKTATIDVIKKPGALVKVMQTNVDPKEGYEGMAFTFTASTDIPAKGVTLKIAGNNYPMTGSGTNWTLKHEIEGTGNTPYSIVAINEDNRSGIESTGSFDVQELTKRYTKNEDGTITDKLTKKVIQRFVDNGDGTITDLATNRMWQKSPKRLLASYEDAEEYCAELSKEGYSGWRLPTRAEWNNLLDKSQEAPALPMGHPFKNIIYNQYFWSKSKYKNMAQRIYVADLYRGETVAQSMNDDYYVWPVRLAD